MDLTLSLSFLFFFSSLVNFTPRCRVEKPIFYSVAIVDPELS